MASLLPLSPRTPVAPGLKYLEMPKTQINQTESRQTRTFPNTQPTHPPLTSSHKQNPDIQDQTSDTDKELLLEPRSHLSKISIQLGNSVAHQESDQHKLPAPTKHQPDSRSLQEPLLNLPQITATSDSKPIGRTAVAEKKEAVTMDLG